METAHACYVHGDHWHCEACDFRGTMEEAIKHTIDNQFVGVVQ